MSPCSLFFPSDRSAGWFSPAASTEGSSNTFTKGGPCSLLTTLHKGPGSHILNQACRVSSWGVDCPHPMQSPPSACDCGSCASHLGRVLGSLLLLLALIHCQDPWQGMVLARGSQSPLPGMKHWTTGEPELSFLCTISLPESGIEGWQMGPSKTPVGLGV